MPRWPIAGGGSGSQLGDYRSKGAFTFAHVLQVLAESGQGQPTPIVTIPAQ